MPDPKPTPDTVTVASQSIELLLTGKPDVKYKWGSGSIRPSLVIFTYRQEGIRAHLYGVWVREDGEVTDQPCDQAYRIGDTDEWPDWLADLAREHKPADRALRRDQVAEALRAAAFECDGNCGLSEQDCYDAHPISFSAMSNGVTHVTGSVTAIADAVLAVLPAPADRTAILREAADTVDAMNEGCSRRQPCGACNAREDAADSLRRMADEAQATPCSQPNPCENGGDPCTTHERERAHAEGDHGLCGAECTADRCTCDSEDHTHDGGCPLYEPDDEAQQPETRQSCACGQDGCEYCDVDDETQADGDVFELPGPEVVAYRNSDRPGVLLCREHGDGWWGLTPLTSDDLPDGGTCTYGDPADPDDVCGRDVLIPRPGKEA